MLSIVYITCNRSDELVRSILSCEEHVSVEHEYIIIDNGSEDDTEEKVSELLKRGLKIDYLLQTRNLGVSGGRNVGYEVAKGDICYFIDDDATVVSDGLCLDDAYQYLKEHDSILAMGTDCYDTERKIQLVGIPEKNKEINTISRIRNYVGCSHFIKKIGPDFHGEYLYPDNLMYGAEELYSGLSIYRVYGEVVQFPNVKVLHQPSKSTRESRVIRQRNGHVNTYVIKKYFLPIPFNIISSIMFFFRILRFEKFSIRRVLEDYQLVKERYDVLYRKKIGIKRVCEIIKIFGIKLVL